MSRTFGAVIIGDEILSGKRQDKHFAKIAEMLGQRGLRLSWVEYLGDDRARLTATFRRTMAAGDVVFSCGGDRRSRRHSASGWNCTRRASPKRGCASPTT
jgi:molybdopterin biosynthesis enzyme MoaB